ncbi:hypothetical protein RD792_008240 [Penstemon davidsonii]|uniref:Glycosyltransferase n=1 Tax=Penstemon davidsonii TaxID=160366 RepID=A0ABR0D8T4_9LAMI|nr:hypothetical protein RD792_008240 [Penstemon davidsonii]
MSNSFKGKMYYTRTHKKEKPKTLHDDQYDALLEYWQTEDFEEISDRASQNRASDCGGRGQIVHYGGAKPRSAYEKEMRDELGCEPTVDEVFFRMYTRKDEDGNIEWASQATEAAYVWAQTQGVSKKGTVLGLSGRANSVIDWMSRILPLKAIGPTIPSMYLDKRLQEDTDYGLNMLKPQTDICINWLNQQQPRSVIYVSFGSLVKLSLEQTQELSHALRTCDKHFLWVVRSSEEAKLPVNFSKDTFNKGLIVSWSPQLQVLSHDSIGCFITHCGWNSILEGLSMGVPMLAMPQWTDQSTNAKFVVDVWKTGIKARMDEKGLVRQEEISRCLKFVMEGEDGEKIRMSAAKWKEMAKEAIDEGGSSDMNIEEFVSTLRKSNFRSTPN